MQALRFSKWLVLIIVTASIVSCSSDEKKLEQYYESALEYIQNSDNPSAIIELRNVINLDAKHADARYQLGLLYLKENEPQKAFQQLVRAASLAPENLDANLKTAEFYFLTKNKEESRRLVEHILQIDPNYHDALSLHANLALSDGNVTEALMILDQAEDTVNQSSTLLRIKGRTYAATNDYMKAEESFRRAVLLDETFGNYMALVLLYRQQLDSENEKKTLNEIVGKFPDNPQSHLLLASLAQSEGRFDQAESELQKAIEINPENVGYRLRLADFYRTRENLDKVEQTLIQAQSELENNPQITSILATYYLDKKDYSEAQPLLEQLQSNYPDHGETKLLEARFLLNEGKSKDALVILQSLSSDFPKWSEPSFYEGLAHLSVGEIDLAQHAVATAIDKNRTSTRYHALMSKLLQTQGTYEEAMREAAIALKLDPRNLTSAILLGKSLIGMKEFDKAADLFEKLNKQVPDNLEILGSLAVSYYGIKQFEELERTILEILKNDPANSQAILFFIAIKYKDNEVEEAVNFVQSKIKEIPDDFRLHLILGNLLQRQDKMNEALTAFDTAQKLNPDNVASYLTSAKILNSLGKIDDAQIEYETLINQHPDSISGYMGLAALHHAEGEINEAIKYYKKILELKDNYVPAANNLAWLLAETLEADLGEALRLAMIAKNESPSDPYVADTLGWVHYKRGSFQLAIAQFEFALQSGAELPVISYHLALTLNSDGQTEAAIEVLEELLSSDVEFEERSNAEELLEILRQK